MEFSLTSGSVMKNADKDVKYNRLNVNVFEATVNPREKGTLVISENYFPGWNAYENGKKLKVFKTNVCFMAVSLEAGNHKIVFKYEPIIFAISTLFSLIALGLLMAAGFLNMKNLYTKG